jgi:hypothetical protein
MKNIIPLLLTLYSFSLWADSCFPLYQQKADEIQEKDGYTKNVGGQLYVNQGGGLGYWPGVKVQANIDNWAEDFVRAIKWGPNTYSFSSEDPRKNWLEAFRKSIKNECKLPEKNYDKLQAMLKELMEDGTFCPNNKILEPGFLGSKKVFVRIFKSAVKDKRFEQYCDNTAIKDDSFRETKDIDSRKTKSSGKSTSSASDQ